MKNSNTLVLAHYYTSPQVQQIADFVGDSLYLSNKAKESNAERIVFAGVKFMAETAKIINPNAQVILPDAASTCSLVTQSEERETPYVYTLEENLLYRKDIYTRVTYINSSYQVKANSDVIVTSSNVEDIISDLINEGKGVYFSPDRNMGAYLASQHPEWGDMFDYYDKAVCEVHDKFASDKLRAQLLSWSNYPKFLLAHPESPLPVLNLADYVGSTSAMLKWVEDYPFDNATILVATEEHLLLNMKMARPTLDIRLAPTYMGCQCNSCPYMDKNTIEAVQAAIDGTSGYVIDYIDEDIRLRALKPIERMLEWRSPSES